MHPDLSPHLVPSKETAPIQRRNTKGTIILGATASDPHVVPIFLAKLMLEEDGYDVRNLRCFNDVADFARAAAKAARDTGAFTAVVVANNNGAAAEDLVGLRDHMQRHGTQAPVILGGHYGVGLRKKTSEQADLRANGVTHFCDDMDALLPLINGLNTSNDAPMSNLQKVPACSPLA